MSRKKQDDEFYLDTEPTGDDRIAMLVERPKGNYMIAWLWDVDSAGEGVDQRTTSVELSPEGMGAMARLFARWAMQRGNDN